MAISACGPVFIDQQGREMVQHGTPLFPAACYQDDIRRAEVPWHWHEELEALVVQAGAARVSVNGADHLVKEGEGFFINAGALHGAWPAGEGSCLLRSVVFHPRLVGGSVDSILWQKYLEPLLCDPCRPCVFLGGAKEWEQAASSAIQAAWQACAAEAEGFEFAVRERLSALIFLLFQNCPAQQKSPSGKALRDGGRVKAMLQYIQQHYAGALTLAAIAQSASLSENECLRCFRSMTGSTPIQYLKQLRIQKAAELLASTDWKIADIGAACGFQEMSYFARAFRELKGCTPSAYRKGLAQNTAK